MKLSSLIPLLVLAVSTVFGQSNTEQLPAPTPCGQRIRKSWDMLTAVEKQVYIRAIERSMDDGLYIKFVEIHTEQMTTAEAHGTCMFIYWHRLLLLGFENMLRSYGGEFACLTVPYWNYVDHNELYLNGQCDSMEACSPILQELGGSTQGTTASVTVNGTPVRGTCVRTRPANHFCEASHLQGADCARCIPRGNWLETGFPPTASVSSLMRQLFSSPTIGTVATSIEQGIHNTMHNSLGGIMGVLEAPADPIFFSHHATLDLLHSLFFHCAVGDVAAQPLEQRVADPRQYVACQRREALPIRSIDRDVLLPESNAMLRSGEEGVQALSVWNPSNPLAPFFASLPTSYAALSDIRNLGAFSYNYQYAGLLANMFTTCADVTSLLGTATRPGAFGSFRRLETQAANSSSVEAVIMPTETSDQWYVDALREAVTATKTNLTEQSSSSSPMEAALREVEKMTCMFYSECRRPVTDLSTSFRRSFHAQGSTPCSKIISDITAGRDAIRVPNWKTVMLRHLNC
ncbi:hypothetical protein Poli38472_002090 [Pythium oligandrum]|uniref:Tyrosinase copper-binding domain-containing protein n=1 Tax=Pythium oligandrum TaxID=41045 RepID=A0A8K1FJI0_PYTOL|nr:hypothetical protein Poli38472_002090 [Pythium oligandrum]|eukprot:TMW63149.1 hypothetical protein Poli38472_002090 [Pythium oligandrum]